LTTITWGLIRLRKQTTVAMILTKCFQIHHLVKRRSRSRNKQRNNRTGLKKYLTRLIRLKARREALPLSQLSKIVRRRCYFSPLRAVRILRLFLMSWIHTTVESPWMTP
jgi:hypothetical protein